MKTLGERIYVHVATIILWSGNAWKRLVSCTTKPPHTRGKNPQYPLSKGLGRPQSGSGGTSEGKKAVGAASNGIPVVHTVASPHTDLSYTGSFL
jgi:hypothetical protein